MILVTRLGGEEFVINADHILYLERTPDTVLTLTTGARLMVSEPVDAVVARVVSYRRRILHGPEVVDSAPTSES